MHEKNTSEELETFPEAEISASTPLSSSGSAHLQPKKKRTNKTRCKIFIEEWRKRLVLALDNEMSRALGSTTQLAIDIDSYNRAVPRRHCKCRFPFFKNPRLRDEFHTDYFFPSVRLVQNHACVQTPIEKNTEHWEVCPMIKESHSLRSLLDFSGMWALLQF